jgi:hypothetical protein
MVNFLQSLYLFLYNFNRNYNYKNKLLLFSIKYRYIKYIQNKSPINCTVCVFCI